MELTTDDIIYFRQKLNIFNGAMQRPDGYGGLRNAISDPELKLHLEGQRAYGFCVDAHHFDKKFRIRFVTARFAGIDIDRDFTKRIIVLYPILEGLGLKERCFLTGGSREGKGKLIFPLVDGIDRYRVAEFLEQILKKAHSVSPDLFPEKTTSGDIELYPRRPRKIEDSSGLLRIAGRNITRNGELENIASLDGEVISLDV
jgi:hypothetical protein